MFFKLDKNFSLNKLERKLNKLKRDPDLFLKDMISNQKVKVQKTINKVKPVKPATKYQYTIVSAIYNVNKYLDEYFESIIKQSVDFKKSIYIICVDDGSTDNSADIIKRWVNKYPKNIQYIYKENGGQSTARNLGLKNVKTDWVTFIDPDDLISVNYFLEVDNFISENKMIDLVSLPMAIYNEKNKVYHYDKFPLSFCYKQNKQIVSASDLKEKIQLSVCNAIFNYKVIKKNAIKFNDKIKPNFEDGRFALDFISKAEKIGYLNTEHYFYRVREDNSSTTNGQWLKKEKYSDVLKYGFLDLFKKNINQYGRVLDNVQRTFLYFAVQYLKNIINNPNLLDFLSEKEKENFVELFYECFNYIDVKNIMNFHLLGCDYFYKYSMISGIKGDEIKLKIVYLDKFDREKNGIILNHYSLDDEILDIYINGELVVPYYIKFKEIKFVNKKIVNENKIFIQYRDEIKKISIVGKSNVIIKFDKKEYSGSIDFKKFKYKKNNVKNDIWLFMDKDYKADDNGEHFYRFIKDNHPDIEIYFALKKESPDWTRLENDRFNLIEFGSSEFEYILNKSSKILSSQADKYLMEYNGDETLIGKKFIFLQHGVIATDISTWLNNVKKIDLFVTSTFDEYNYISGINSPYSYTPYNTYLTGLPRHDQLLKKSLLSEKANEIIIMPTWRSSFIGKLIENSAKREKKDNFKQTDYYKNWVAFFNHPTLLEISHKFKLTLIPHPNIIDYIEDFSLPSFINVKIPDQNYSYQDAFISANALITDYSSVAFDMAFLHKPTLYYTFDLNDTKVHSSKKGYLDYHKNGFGPASDNVEDLIKSLVLLIEQDFVLNDVYTKRISNSFPLRDGKNCQRIYESILKLDESEELSNKFVFEQYLSSLFANESYDQYKRYVQKYFNEYTSNEIFENFLSLAAKKGKWNDIESLLDQKYDAKWDILLKYHKHKWQSVIKLIDEHVLIDSSNFLYVLSSCIQTNRIDIYKKIRKLLHKLNLYLTDEEKDCLKIFDKFVANNLEECIASMIIFEENYPNSSYANVLLFKVIESECHMVLENYDAVRSIIHKIQPVEESSLFLKIKASIQFYDCNYKSSAYWFGLINAFTPIIWWEEKLIIQYLKCLIELDNYSKFYDVYTQCLESNKGVINSVSDYYILALFNLKKYNDIISYINNKVDIKLNIRFIVIFSLYRVGKINEAHKLISHEDIFLDYEYWKIIMEISIIVSDLELEKHCNKYILALFPEKIDEYLSFKDKIKLVMSI